MFFPSMTTFLQLGVYNLHHKALVNFFYPITQKLSAGDAEKEWNNNTNEITNQNHVCRIR